MDDDFLFPMSSATNNRLSYYNSSPESDGEFCDASNGGGGGGGTTPRHAAAVRSHHQHLASIVGSSNTLSSTGIVHGSGATGGDGGGGQMARSTSDPSIAPNEVEAGAGVIGSINSGGIPDYNVPPPYAVTPKQVGG